MKAEKKNGSKFDHLNIPQYPSLHLFLCVRLFPLTLVVCFLLHRCETCVRNWIHIFGSFLEARYPMRSPCATSYWKMLTMRGGKRHVKPWGFEMKPQLDGGLKQLLLPLSLGIWFPFDWCVSNGLKTPTIEQVMEVFCSILSWIPKKFHNNHVLEQINSFQTCQSSGVFFICNFRASGIYLLRPHFSRCVVP